jgi:predicted nucleotidyltransferase
MPGAELQARANIAAMAAMPDRRFDSCRRAAAAHGALRLLVLFGSRGRGDHRPESDWDFGYLADPSLDELALRADLARALETERIDLVDLARASGLLRYRAVRDGVVILDRQDTWPSFTFDVATFWFDAEPVLNAEYEAMLERM